MSSQVSTSVSDSVRDYALSLFESLPPAEQWELIALAAAALASQQ